MNWKNVKLIFLREVRDQLRDRRTLFMITILPVLLYPMLGLGMVEMMLTFSEQKRAVVILNADELPNEPAFLDEDGIRQVWFGDGGDKSSLLQVVTDRPHPGAEQNAQPESRRRRGFSPEQLLSNGRAIAEQFRNLQAASDHEDGQTRLAEIQDRLGVPFADSGIQVLVLVPDGYAESIRQLQEQTDVSDDQSEIPNLQIIRNSADDKSAVAFARVKSSLQNWESILRKQILRKAELRQELQYPARLQYVELANGEEVSANIWSKLFPAMLVIMALTGAFYPAIDLGAGEKERGTMETLLISPARRVELVLGKFATIMMFSIGTALMNLLSMGFTGRHMASTMGAAMADNVSLELPGWNSLMWLLILLVPLAALFSALCLALATFAKSTKEGQYYLTPLLMVIMGLTMFCLSPAVEITPLYSVIPVVNVALLLKGLLLSASASNELLMYAVPVLVSSFGYSVLALWWAIDLYNSEDVLFREAEKFDLKIWFMSLTKAKEPVPAFQEAAFCFIIILFLQFVAMEYMKPDFIEPVIKAGASTAEIELAEKIAATENSHTVLRVMVIQQLAMIACPAILMAILLTTSLKATLRLRMPSLTSIALGAALACLAHPLSVELSIFMVERGFLPPPPTEGLSRVNEWLQIADLASWKIIAVFAITPAICEEIAFRGFILAGLARGNRLGIAVIVSSLMFGIIHMIPQQAFNAALLGLILGLLAIHSRSLFPPMIFHFCNNTIATFHGQDGFGIKSDNSMFFTHIDGMLRYEWPTLIICMIGVGVLVAYMLRDLNREQEAKRLQNLESFEPPEPVQPPEVPVQA